MKHVVLYTSPSCSACQTVKEFLSRHHVDFEERSLEDSRWAEELAERHGAVSAPAVVVEDVLLEGSLPSLAAALGLEGF
jgi:glutaredoxin